MEQANLPEEKNTPFGLYIISIIQLAIAILLGLALLGEDLVTQYLRLVIRNPLFYSGYGWLLVGLLLLAVIGLLRLKRWGWVLTMFLTGIGLGFNIWNYFQGTPNFIAMVGYLVIVFYLNQREVQRPFRSKVIPGRLE
jgi:hypothetical protein